MGSSFDFMLKKKIEYIERDINILINRYLENLEQEMTAFNVDFFHEN
jgi:hypothetical protein